MLTLCFCAQWCVTGSQYGIRVKGEIVQCFLVLVIRCSRKSNEGNWNLNNLYASIVLKKFLRIHWHLGDFTFVSSIPHEHPLLCSLKLFFNCDKHLSCLTWRTIRNVLPLVSGLAFLKLNLNPISFQLHSSKRKRSEGFSFGERDINVIRNGSILLQDFLL